jgi:hypothetical protein
MGMFCRHNRLTARCPICSVEEEAKLRAQLPSRPPRERKAAAKRSTSARRPSGLRTRQLRRAPDDGYRNPLVPGLRATADARRLAATLGAAAARLEFPGPYPQVAEAGDPEEAAWLAFQAVTGDDPEHPAVPAYQAWAERHGAQIAALTGDERWTPTQRFGRIFDRIAFPGFPRASRYELLTTLDAAGVVALEADALRPAGDDDPATTAAKRILLTGDRSLMERRAKELARAAEVPLAALDHALAEWEAGGGEEHDPPPAAARALGI